MMKRLTVCCLLLLPLHMQAQQPGYIDSLTAYRQKYIQEHEAVAPADRHLLDFYAADSTWRVRARFELVNGMGWFDMETSGTRKKAHRVYGLLHFQVKDSNFVLRVYQSKELLATKQYKDWLFVPFTDKTSGITTYANGRYIDLLITELENGKDYLLDFNKAYNPYCAYISGMYNCPIPPAENDLPVAITAGEKIFRKSH